MLRGVQVQFSIYRRVRSYGQSPARSIVVLIGNRVQLLLAVTRQVLAFWLILSTQAIHVFVAAYLPWAEGGQK